MTRDAYPALFHHLHKAMAGVDFPATKAEILAKAGDRDVYVDWERTVKLRSFVEPIPGGAFSCAADFSCRLIAAL